MNWIFFIISWTQPWLIIRRCGTLLSVGHHAVLHFSSTLLSRWFNLNKGVITFILDLEDSIILVFECEDVLFSLEKLLCQLLHAFFILFIVVFLLNNEGLSSSKIFFQLGDLRLPVLIFFFQSLNFGFALLIQPSIVIKSCLYFVDLL